MSVDCQLYEPKNFQRKASKWAYCFLTTDMVFDAPSTVF